MDPVQLTQACEHARRAALEAWAAVCHYHRGRFTVENKHDGPATEADRLADHLIGEYLHQHYPARRFGFLGEEIARDPIRLERRHVWIFDPIDGTRAFINGTGDFAVQIGLAEERDGAWIPVVGVVYHPIAGKLFRSVRGEGAFLECEHGIGDAPETETDFGNRWWWRAAEEAPRPVESARFHSPRRLRVSEVDSIADMTAVVSASHQTRLLHRVLDAVAFKENYARGSIGVKAAELAQARADAYVNTQRGKCKEWDLCAPHLIVEEAGGVVTDLDGRPITYNHEQVLLDGGILGSNGKAHAQLVDLISPLTA